MANDVNGNNAQGGAGGELYDSITSVLSTGVSTLGTLGIADGAAALGYNVFVPSVAIPQGPGYTTEGDFGPFYVTPQIAQSSTGTSGVLVVLGILLFLLFGAKL